MWIVVSFGANWFPKRCLPHHSLGGAEPPLWCDADPRPFGCLPRKFVGLEVGLGSWEELGDEAFASRCLPDCRLCFGSNVLASFLAD